jgi:iron complex outermembrane receptor protein
VFIPLLADLPFVKNLNVNASVRYTDYASYGSDTTYKIAGEWEFFDGVGIRGSYGTSYRAPALAEQFLGATSGFIGSGSDPCDADNFPANPANYSSLQQTVAANCSSIGLNVATFQQNSGITVFTRGGAETGLAAETSRNWSAGVVLRPKISGSTSLSLALDYFDIKVSNGVSSLGGGTILSRCYSDTAFTPTTGFCRFVSRDTNNILTVTSGYVNLSVDIVKGFEFNGRFSTDVLGGRFTLNSARPRSPSSIRTVAAIGDLRRRAAFRPAGPADSAGPRASAAARHRPDRSRPGPASAWPRRSGRARSCGP